jgi:RNA polymerase sigma-70 factor (sigma-E family)
VEANSAQTADHAELLTVSRHHRQRHLADGGDGPGGTDRGAPPGGAEVARATVSALYETHATGLIRLAVVMLGDRPAAEDVVQDAFCALYRRWEHLSDASRALGYLRSSILNGCRSELRHRIRNRRRAARHPAPTDIASAETDVLIGEEHLEVLAALRRLPRRQREALVLRFYLDLPEPEIAAAMGITQGTVKSTTSRGLGALAQLLQEDMR